LTDDKQVKLDSFGIINELYKAQSTGKRYLNYEDLEKNLGIDRTQSHKALVFLEGLGHIRTWELAAILEKKAINVMATYQPKNFEQFISKYQGKEKFWSKKTIGILLTIGTLIVAVIGLLLNNQYLLNS